MLGAALAVIAGGIGFAVDAAAKWGNPGWEFLPEWDVMAAVGAWTIGGGIVATGIGAWRFKPAIAVSSLFAGATMIALVGRFLRYDPPAAAVFLAAAAAAALAACVGALPLVVAAIRKRLR